MPVARWLTENGYSQTVLVLFASHILSDLERKGNRKNDATLFSEKLLMATASVTEHVGDHMRQSSIQHQYTATQQLRSQYR